MGKWGLFLLGLSIGSHSSSTPANDNVKHVYIKSTDEFRHQSYKNIKRIIISTIILLILSPLFLCILEKILDLLLG